MQFIKTTDWDEGTAALTERLRTELGHHKRVLWLLCGGSNITASVQVMEKLDDEATKNLAIFLTDERFGEVGHADSNSKQLYDAGFKPKQAVFVPMLAPDLSLQQTQERYAQAMKRAVDHADVIIAQFGIGSDGHIAGILPHSTAVTADGWLAGYEASPYTRITLTFEALRHISVAFAMAFGNEKRQALEQLRDENLTLDDEPSQILKELPEAYIFNDQIGEKA